MLCGAAASGNFEWTGENVAKSALCMLMSGPLLTGYTQTINDYYDKEIDAINEPYRPIPSGAISEPEVITQILVLLAGGIGVAYALDCWAGHATPIMTYLAIGGSFVSYIYSAPPLKLKQSGWAGNYALGSSYIALPWWAGQVRPAAAADGGVVWWWWRYYGLGVVAAVVMGWGRLSGRTAEPTSMRLAAVHSTWQHAAHVIPALLALNNPPALNSHVIPALLTLNKPPPPAAAGQPFTHTHTCGRMSPRRMAPYTGSSSPNAR